VMVREMGYKGVTEREDKTVGYRRSEADKRLIEMGTRRFEGVSDVLPFKLVARTDLKTNEGKIALYSEVDGSKVGEWDVLTQGTKATKALYGAESWMHTNGDTPAGVYKVGALYGGEPSTPARPDTATPGSYGTGFISLTPISGNALDAHQGVDHRDGIAVHGGGRGAKDPYADRQSAQLYNTQGCFRMYNVDVNQMIQRIKETSYVERQSGVQQTNTLTFTRESKMGDHFELPPVMEITYPTNVITLPKQTFKPNVVRPKTTNTNIVFQREE